MKIIYTDIVFWSFWIVKSNNNDGFSKPIAFRKAFHGAG